MKTEKIGEMAGDAWRCLRDNGPQNLSAMKKMLGADDQCLYMALGWLAREDKISFRQQNRAVIVSLK